MVIRASSSREVDSLLRDLRSDRAIARDAAVARLTVIGARAVTRLLSLAKDTKAATNARAAAWRALEAIADPRALPEAIVAAGAGDPAVAVAAIGVLRAFLNGDASVAVLDRLTGVALDRARPTDVRVVAIRALGECERKTVAPVFASLASDEDPAVAAAATSGGDSESPSARQILLNAAAGSLPESARGLKNSLTHAAHEIPITALHQIVQKVREREESLDAERRGEWTMIRAAAHLALAERDSRLALYDLRETIEAAKQPVAVEFLSALSIIGDASCLEPIAAAYSHAGTATNDWWHSHLRDAFKAIVDRHGVTKRHAVMKKIEKRWPGGLML